MSDREKSERNQPMPQTHRPNPDDILARADELAAWFESEDFDGEQVSPEEYMRLRNRST
ncbi:hypothetical protein [Tsukamurella tyrosinosolvens]|uniref:hypothetical protein n=1 Tax=Tsukamurella tyrosinosolvens TaxID=57704 RepID=UPI003F4A20D1